MNNILGLNIKHLRKDKDLTQDQLADKIGVNRAMIGSYEEGRAVPKIAVLQTLSAYFKVSIDHLVGLDLSQPSPERSATTPVDAAGAGLRVLSTLVDRDNKELMTVVPVKVSAGYLNGFADPDFIEQLPRFNLPLPELSADRTYRPFQIKGNSMEPVPDGAYIICEYQPNWHDIKSGKPYIVVTITDGVVYKRLFKHDDSTLLLKSDNPEYEPYNVAIESVREVWRALGYISFALPEPDDLSMGKLSAMVYKMQNELENLRKEKKG